MTVESSVQDVTYDMDGVTLTFAIPFYFLENDHIYADFIDSAESIESLVNGTQFSLSGAGDEDGGSLTLANTKASGNKLHIYRVVPVTQESAYQQNSAFPAATTETALDKLTMIAQQQAAAIENSIRYPLQEYGTDGTLPIANDRANKVLGFADNGAQTLLPMPASVGAGDLKNEYWKAGTDFTAGTTSRVQLSRAYLSKANIGTLVIDGLGQAPDTYDVTADGYVVFLDDSGNETPIPANTQKIYCVGGTTLSLNTPATGSVTDASIANGTALYERIFGMVSVMDPKYGAKGDCVRDASGNYLSGTDDTSAIQKCLNENTYVRFPAGFAFYSASGFTVPDTCKQIEATAAWLVGPGYTSGVNGFTFSGFYQGAGDIQQRSEKYVLPSMQGFQHCAHLYNSAFLRIDCDTMRNCVWGYFQTCDSAENYCMENWLTARHIWHARNSANTDGGAFGVQMTGTATSSFQGNRCRVFYADDCWAAVKQDFSSSGTGGNINNLYEILECDQSTYAVYNTKKLSSGNTFYFPMGITSPGSANMFPNFDTQDNVEILGCKTNNPAFAAAVNFQWIGVSNRAFISVQSGGVPVLYVSTDGSDTTGNGHDTAPFATIQKAVDTFSELDLNGGTVYVALRDGSYAAGATLSKSVNGKIAIIGDTTTPTNVVVNGSFTADGAGTYLSVSAMMLRGGVVAQNGGRVDIDSSLDFDAFAGGRHIYSYNHGTVNINSNYSVTGQASYHMLAQLNGTIKNNGASAVTCTGTFSFSAFAQAQQGAQIEVSGITYSGSGVGGSKYYATKGGGINTGGSSGFPGSVAGTTDTNGWYA
ncbi:hypothetical protein [Paraburkholderia sp. SIMBA_027]|uniref:hypothetical protein n=2 Tax=Bacteria TaxID=2 RepID=UPI00397B0BCA